MIGRSTDKKQMDVILRGRDKTKQAFRSMKSNADQSKKAIKQAFTAMKASALAFEVAVVAGAVMAMKKMVNMTVELTRSSVNTADQFEVLRLQMQTLQGSVEKGNATFEKLWTTAKKIPFTIDDIAKGAKTLQAFGMLGDDVETAMIGIADASAAAGVSIDTMAVVMGRAWQMGNFLTRGPGAIFKGIMQTKMGIEDITKLSLPEFQKAVGEMLTNPKYGIAGMSEKLATTWTGIRSMISDSMTQIKLSIAEAGVFEEVKRLGESIRDWLRREDIVGVISRIGSIAGEMIGELHDTLTRMVESGDLKILLEDWVNTARKWANSAKDIIKNIPAISRIIMNMVQTLSMALAEVIDKLYSVLNSFDKISGTSAQLTRNINSTATAMTELSEKTTQVSKTYRWIAREADRAWDARSIQTVIQVITSGIDRMSEFAGESEEAKKSIALARQELERISQAGGKVGAKQILKVDVLPLLEDAMRKITKEYANQSNVLNEQHKLHSGQLKQHQETLTFTGQIRKAHQDILDLFKEQNEEIDATQPKLDETKTKADKIAGAFNVGAEKVLTIKKHWEEVVAEFKKTTTIGIEVSKSLASSFETIFFDAMTNQLKTLNDYLLNFGRNLAQIMAQWAAMQTMKGLTGMFSGAGTPGAGSGSVAGMLVDAGIEEFPTGGIVSGIGTAHKPVLAQPGEMYLNREQQHNLLNMLSNGNANNGGSTIINISAMDTQSMLQALSRDPQLIPATIARANKAGTLRNMR